MSQAPITKSKEQDAKSDLLDKIFTKMQTNADKLPMQAISVERVGNKGYDYFYPDWYMLTPAYNIDNSGFTKLELFTSLVKPKNENNLPKRIGRLYKEEKSIVYLNKWDTLSTLVTVLLYSLTLFIAITSTTIKARAVYEFTEENSNPSEKEKEWLDKLNYLAVEKNIFLGIQIALTLISSAVLVINVFKRTTVPKSGIEINSIDNRYKITQRAALTRDRSIRNLQPLIKKLGFAKVAPAPGNSDKK